VDASVTLWVGLIVGGLVGYTLALAVNYLEYWTSNRRPVELDEQLEAFRRLQER
jgi:hypothetical protein